MATAIATVCVTSTTWCFCTACASLLGACCGNDKASTIPPSVTSGRKRSVLLLVLSIGLALGFQYGVAPALVDTDINNPISDAWLDGCDYTSEENPDTAEDLQTACAGNAGVYRVGLATSIFFTLAAIAAACKPTANREAWPAKYVLWAFLCVAMLFIPNEPLFSDIYLNIARIGAILFIIVQQLVIVDMAHDWNDSWVGKADEAEAEEPGSGKKWLTAILVSCAILFTASIVSIALLFVHFGGCADNNAFISLTLIFGILITAAQLSGEEGSLLSSGCVFLWAVFLCYTAVTKNPDTSCNPKYGESDAVSIVLGIVVTLMSLGWTGWSYTAEDKLTGKSDDASSPTTTAAAAEEEENKSDDEKKVTGIVTGAATDGDEESPETAAADTADADTDADEAAKNDPKRLSNSWKLNVILLAVACWMSMVLTNFGVIAADGNAANPQAGQASMWVVIGSQWFVLALYLWTLVAPRLFPNRDFS